MSALLETQRQFGLALLHAAAAEDALLPLLRGDDQRTRAGIAAYRRSVMGNLTAAMQGCYPVVAELVGGPFFREAARRYLIEHPSRSGDLNSLGGLFGGFLETYAPAQSLPYLPDMARLEWRIQQVYGCDDAPPVELSRLATAAPDDYPGLHFTIAPDCARLDSAWALARIWQWHQPGADRAKGIDPAGPCQLLIHRGPGRIVLESLTPGEASFFDTLYTGLTLGDATTRATERDPGFDLGSALGRLINAGLLQQAHGGSAA